MALRLSVAFEWSPQIQCVFALRPGEVMYTTCVFYICCARNVDIRSSRCQTRCLLPASLRCVAERDIVDMVQNVVCATRGNPIVDLKISSIDSLWRQYRGFKDVLLSSNIPMFSTDIQYCQQRIFILSALAFV